MKFIFKILTISLTTCIVFINSTFSQNQILDKKRGFKNFTLGDSKAKYQAALTYYMTAKDGSIGYTYDTKNVLETYVFDYKLSKIILFFDKAQKLSVINLEKDYDSESYSKSLEDLKNIINDLTGYFGDYSQKYRDDEQSKIGATWAGNEVLLTCTNLYLGFKTGSQINILISKYNKNDASGF
ncbi:hypothetical protein [Mucilaginibacter sp.]|uniref:hypothetical protein n=1 Tax=Mucilaginibacter sp. TaxID=1882438 RepID=UPI003AFF6D5B